MGRKKIGTFYDGQSHHINRDQCELMGDDSGLEMCCCQAIWKSNLMLYLFQCVIMEVVCMKMGWHRMLANGNRDEEEIPVD